VERGPPKREEKGKRERLEKEAYQKRRAEERERRLDMYIAQERKFRAEQKKWNEMMGRPRVGQTVALLVRGYYRSVLGTIVETEEKEWETETRVNGTFPKGRGRFDLGNADSSPWGVWVVQIPRSEVEGYDSLTEYCHRFCGDCVYFLMSELGLGEEWATDTYVSHLRGQVSADTYARLIFETYSMGESRAIFFKKRCRKGKSCADERVGHLLNEKH